MSQLNPSPNRHGSGTPDPLLPWEIFDVIGGTSTGGYVHGSHVSDFYLTETALITTQHLCRYAWYAEDECGRGHRRIPIQLHV